MLTYADWWMDDWISKVLVYEALSYYFLCMLTYANVC